MLISPVLIFGGALRLWGSPHQVMKSVLPTKVQTDFETLDGGPDHQGRLEVLGHDSST